MKKIQELENTKTNYLTRLSELDLLINIPVITSGSITISSISGSGTEADPWLATVSATTIDTSQLFIYAEITATNGTGSLYGGAPQIVSVETIGTNTFTYKIVGGTIPVAGTITNLIVYPPIQNRVGYEAEKSWAN